MLVVFIAISVKQRPMASARRLSADMFFWRQCCPTRTAYASVLLTRADTLFATCVRRESKPVARFGISASR